MRITLKLFAQLTDYLPVEARRTSEMGCTEAEWRASAPRALANYLHQFTDHALTVQIGTGQLRVSWAVAEPRVIALARIPRLLVHFCSTGLDDAQRLAFMKHFDLYMQRGGG